MILMLILAATPITIDEVRAGSRQNLQAVQAALQVESSQANQKLARAAILPRLDVSAGAQFNYVGSRNSVQTVPVFDADGKQLIDAQGKGVFKQEVVATAPLGIGNFNFQAVITQLLYDGGRWWNFIAQTNSQTEADQGRFQEQQLASELEAVRRFFELVRSQLTLKVLLSSIERSKDQLVRARSLYEAGRGQRRDVLDAEVNLGNDEISAMRQEQSIASAQVDLMEWLGRPAEDVEAVVPVEMDVKVVPQGAPKGEALLENARGKRPLIYSLEAQIRAQELAVSAARSSFFPTVSLSGGYVRSAPSADPFFTDPTKQNAVFVGLGINWNVFGGFTTVAQMDAAKVQVRVATAQQLQALAELENEIRRTLRTLETQLRISSMAEKNRSLAETQLAVETERFNAGASSNIDVRNAQVKVTQAQLTQLQGRVDIEIARAALQRVSGASAEGSP